MTALQVLQVHHSQVPRAPIQECNAELLHANREQGMPRREFTALEINLKRVYCLFSADLTAYSNVFLRCFVSDSAVISPPFTRSSPAFQPPFKQR